MDPLPAMRRVASRRHALARTRTLGAVALNQACPERGSLPEITPEIAAFLKRVRLGFVATVSPAGRPNVSPKGTIVPLGSSHLAFADIRSPDTMANIAKNPAVEISAIDPLSRRGYLFVGKARACASGPEFEDAMRAYSEMGVRSHIKAVAIVDVESISEVTSPLYDTGMREEEIREAWTRRYGMH